MTTTIVSEQLVDIYGKPYSEAKRIAHNARNQATRERVRAGGLYESTGSDILTLSEMLERFTLMSRFTHVVDVKTSARLKVSRFERAYAGSRMLVNGQPTPVTQLWLQHPDRKVGVSR